jgi:hypothetical protein
MATTEIQASITAITGITPHADLLTNAQKAVASSIPKNLMWAYASKTAGVTTNPVADNSTLIHTDNILGVDRDGFAADQVGFESKGFIGASSGSLFEPTKKYPKWLIAETNEVSVYPVPEAGEEGSVLYVNYGNIADTSDLRNAVVFHAVSQEYSTLARTGLPTWSSPVAPSPPIVPNFGDDASITATPPLAPTITTTTVDISGWTVPIYSKSVLSLTSNPVISDLNITSSLPTAPSSPSFDTGSISVNTDVPTYLKPTFSVPTLGSIGSLTLPTPPVVPETPNFTYNNASVNDIVSPLIQLGDMASATGPPSYTSPTSPTFNFSEVQQTLESMVMPSGVALPTLSIDTFPTMSWTFPLTPVSPAIGENSVSFGGSLDEYVPPILPVFNFTNVVQSLAAMEMPEGVVLPSLEYDTFPTITWNFPVPPVPSEVDAEIVADVSANNPVYVAPVCGIYDFASVVQTMAQLELPPGIVIPSLDFNDPPAVAWNLPSMPVEPILDWSGVTQAVDDIELPPEIVPPSLDLEAQSPITWDLPSPPIPTALDFTDLNNWINVEEDAEMAGARVSAIQSQISVYGTEVQAFQALVNAEVAENQGIITAWGDEWRTRIAKYTGELNALVSKYQGESAGKQAIVQAQVSVLNAQIQEIVQRNQSEVATYQAKIQAYQSNVNAEVTKNQGIIQVWGSEWTTKVQAYTGEVSAVVQVFQATQQGKSQIADSQVKIFGAQVSLAQAEYASAVQKYQADIQNATTDFQKDSAIYTGEMERAVQNANLADKQQERKIAKYSSEVQGYQTEVTSIIQSNTAEISAWQGEWNLKTQKYSAEVGAIINKYQAEVGGEAQVSQSQIAIFTAQVNRSVAEHQLDLARYQADITNNLNTFNKSNIQFQADLQIAIKDAELSSSDNGQILQKYSGDVTAYATEVNNIIQQNTAEIAAWQNEWSLKTQVYTAEVGAIISQYQAEIAGESQTSQSQVAIYSAQINRVVQEHQLELASYQTQIQNALNVFNKENVVYQQDIQKRAQNLQKDLQIVIQDAQNEFTAKKSNLDKDTQLELQNALNNYKVDLDEYNSSIQKYSAIASVYGAEVNAVIQKWQIEEWTQKFNKYQTDYTNLLQTYQVDVQNELNNFNREQTVFQNELQEKIQEATNLQTKDAQEYSAKLQKYASELQSYQADVATQVQEYTINEIQKELSIWSTNIQSDLTTYASDMQNELNKFNELNVVFQAQLQKSIQDAQLDSAEDSQKLQKYASELQEYQQNINKEVADFTNTLNKNVQEYQSELALFGAELTRHQSLVAEQAQKGAADQQTVAFYEKESDKYYNWARTEIQAFIQNNSKMIQQTVAAQAAAQQQGQ